MNKNHLIDSANKLPPISQLAVQEYAKKQELLIFQMNTLMLERTDLETLIGKGNLKMMQDNHANHVDFIYSILKNNNADVLVETVLWVFRAYKSHGFSYRYWTVQLTTWQQILKKELSTESYTEILSIYEWMLTNIPVFIKLSDEKLGKTMV